MSKAAYGAIGGVYRKIKKGYGVVGGVNRKIKKAYSVIGGVNRPCWRGGELTYYGDITELRTARYGLRGARVGDYALIAGGLGSGSTACAYDASLVQHEAPSMGTRGSHGVATVNNNAVFAGGYSGTAAVSSVAAYNASLTISNPTGLSQKRCHLAGTSVGDCALFAGGADKLNLTEAYTTVDAYNASLTRSTPTALSKKRAFLAGTTVGNHALFGGGDTDGALSNIVDAYDASLTRSTATALSVARKALAATTVGEHALFCGGADTTSLMGTGTAVTTTDAYDASLTLSKPTAINTARHSLAAITLGNYALVAGGSVALAYKTTVTAYDIALTRTQQTNITGARDNLAAASIDDFAMFAGGQTSSGYSSKVTAYTIA